MFEAEVEKLQIAEKCTKVQCYGSQVYIKSVTSRSRSRYLREIKAQKR